MPHAIKYPRTQAGNQTDDYHGTQVSDPFRWLEDDVRSNPAVAQWVATQNEFTQDYLGTIPEREQIAGRLRQLWNHERYGLPVKKGGRYFHTFNNGLQNQDVLMMQPGIDAEPELLLDPNGWSDDGTIALAEWYPCPDGRFVACLIQDGGSDWRNARVYDTVSAGMLDDELHWLKFSGLSWTRDGSGFYYSRYPAPASGDRFQSLNSNQAVYFHRLGDPQQNDRLVYARPDFPEWGFGARVTDDGQYLVITIWKGTDDRYQIAIQNLADDSTEPVMLIEGFEDDYALAGNTGATFYFRTSNEAPRGRLVAIDLEQPQSCYWREIIPQSANVLTQAALVGGRIVAVYMADARSLVAVHDLASARHDSVSLPGIGSATGFFGTADDNETFFAWESFDTPPSIWKLDTASGQVQVFKTVSVDFNPGDFVVRQEFFHSPDGTRIPMFIAHHRNVALDGNNPTILYGYGGFNIALQPAFSVSSLVWMEMGGIWAVANLRGGGEYGEEWHRSGTKLDKQNVFDDFIAAAGYLIGEGYTCSRRLAVFGGSNGGLLVGAVVNQRPDLFGAALPAVGVMDMLRFHRFTAGRFWVDDYGSADDEEEFGALYAYSPYHNIRPGIEYPAVLVTTADTDDRVVPGHSFKYAAALQRAQGGAAPVLIRIEARAGHGAGTAVDKKVEESADRWAFLVRVLDMQLPDGFGRN
ncbi:MAG: prolyl oligopeptidase family serine peptidase [Woeseia sp.]